MTIKRDAWFNHYLIDASHDILWFYFEECGDYQGNVYAIGYDEIKKNYLFFKGYYGSCGGCGAWGEGGEPVDKADIYSNSYKTKSYYKFVETVMKDKVHEDYDAPSIDKIKKGLKKLLTYIEKKNI